MKWTSGSGSQASKGLNPERLPSRPPGGEGLRLLTDQRVREPSPALRQTCQIFWARVIGLMGHLFLAPVVDFVNGARARRVLLIEPFGADDSTFLRATSS